MAQFNSYMDFLDLSAAIDFCRENGKLTPTHLSRIRRELAKNSNTNNKK